MDIYRKDKTEDIGFISKIDPWKVLSGYIGKPFIEYREKWEKASAFNLELDYPLQIDFELNNTCNFSCDFCTFSVEKTKKKILFPDNKFKEIVSEGVAKGLRAIDFSFVNEPLLRNDLPELIRFAKDNGVLDMAFNTNAQLLTEEYTNRLLNAGLTRVHFSLDAFSDEVFNEIRKGGDYGKVIKNILYFLDSKKKLNIKTPLTAVSFIRLCTNEHQWNDFVEYWVDKVDFIILREYLIPVGSDNPHYEDKKKLYAGKKNLSKDFKCDKPWQRIVIRADGTVLPCCTFFGAQLPVGNVFEQSIESIWKSPKMNYLRQIHKEGKFYENSVCKECALGSTVESIVSTT